MKLLIVDNNAETRKLIKSLVAELADESLNVPTGAGRLPLTAFVSPIGF